MKLKLPTALWMLLLAAPGQSENIPFLHAQSLADAPVDFPAVLSGRIGVLVIGFSKKSSEQTKRWSESLLPDYGNDGRVAYYEGAVLAEVPGFVRGFVIKSIRAGMALAERAHFVPIVQDAPKWKEAAHYSAPDDAYILVVDGSGRVQWREHGPKTGETYTRLREFVAQARK